LRHYLHPKSIPVDENFQQDHPDPFPAALLLHGGDEDIQPVSPASGAARLSVLDETLAMQNKDILPESIFDQSTAFAADGQGPDYPSAKTFELDQDVTAYSYGEMTQQPLQKCLQAFYVPTEGDIWTAIRQFFDKSWIVFPVLSCDKLCRQLSMTTTWDAEPAQRTLLLAIQMINSACEYRIASENDTAFQTIIRAVEKSRLDYEFAEPATLDDVVVSLFLFVAYNVLEKHTRAYLYLDEAFSLLGVVETYHNLEAQRKHLIELVLFNTETASMAVYAHPGRQRRAKIPRITLDSMPTSSSEHGMITDYEKLALHLVTRLTKIHAAGGARVLLDDFSDSKDLRDLLGMSLQQRQFCRIQAADVSVSQQWQLSTKLLANLRSRALTQKLAMAKAEKLGVAAMAWICSLREGELRIVGLGKIFGMLQAIRAIAGKGGCESVVSGLIGALVREDHDKKFAAGVTRLIAPMISATSPLMVGQCFECGDSRSSVMEDVILLGDDRSLLTQPEQLSDVTQAPDSAYNRFCTAFPELGDSEDAQSDFGWFATSPDDNFAHEQI
jgi:hypothetical protein